MQSYGLENPNRLRKTLSKNEMAHAQARYEHIMHELKGPTLQQSINHKIVQTRNPKKVTLQPVAWKGS